MHHALYTMHCTPCTVHHALYSYTNTRTPFTFTQALRDAFNAIDTENNGVISVEEFETLMKQHVPGDEVQAIFDTMDVDKTGTICIQFTIIPATLTALSIPHMHHRTHHTHHRQARFTTGSLWPPRWRLTDMCRRYCLLIAYTLYTIEANGHVSQVLSINSLYTIHHGG
jgi:hypothetical protein